MDFEKLMSMIIKLNPKEIALVAAFVAGMQYQPAAQSDHKQLG